MNKTTKKIAHNTNYYRKNKISKKKVHYCPHCNYTSAGPKVTIRNHIWAKHTPESEKPFQCTENNCCRGFAQKVLLQRHLKKIHNIDKDLTTKRTIVKFEIQRGTYKPASVGTANRVNHYLSQPDGILYVSQIGNFEFLPGKKLKKCHIYYDAREGYISMKQYTS